MKLEKWHKIMIAILATAAVVGLGWGKIKAIDNRWAHTPVFEEAVAKIELVSARLEQKIVQDQIDWRQKRMSELMSQFGSFQNMPTWARDEYQRLQAEIEKLKKSGG